MLAVITKRFNATIEGNQRRTVLGEIVDVSSWRAPERLVRLGWIRPASDAELRAAGVPRKSSARKEA